MRFRLAKVRRRKFKDRTVQLAYDTWLDTPELVNGVRSSRHSAYRRGLEGLPNNQPRGSLHYACHAAGLDRRKLNQQYEF
jgi:hypothetical protein